MRAVVYQVSAHNPVVMGRQIGLQASGGLDLLSISVMPAPRGEAVLWCRAITTSPCAIWSADADV